MFVMRVLENLDSAPGAVAVSIGNFSSADVGSPVEVTLDSDPTVLLTEEVPDDGNIRTTVLIPSGVAAGEHTLTASSAAGVDSAPFSIWHDSLDGTDTSEDEDPELPDIPEPFERWTLIDVYPGEEESWTFPRNPEEWEGPPERPMFLSFDAACGPSGQILTWQNSGGAWDFTVKGITFTQDEYHDLLRWAHKRRRFWLYDHRAMIWFVTITKFQPEPRAKGIVSLTPDDPGNYDPWLVDYTLEFMVFNKPGDQPFVIEEEVEIA